ncbi:hypothetical protein CRE_29945 [Caenorhabditis remanei]|uniref:Uncharacterized protein n=1 Tax=Caenorhabditis remanei TaxID=31234 RepID=E3MMA9_CAERE|nr:hypothetical protein CRE_29945 [Caenorhabditis remanei]
MKTDVGVVESYFWGPDFPVIWIYEVETEGSIVHQIGCALKMRFKKKRGGMLEQGKEKTRRRIELDKDKEKRKTLTWVNKRYTNEDDDACDFRCFRAYFEREISIGRRDGPGWEKKRINKLSRKERNSVIADVRLLKKEEEEEKEKKN